MTDLDPESEIISPLMSLQNVSKNFGDKTNFGSRFFQHFSSHLALGVIHAVDDVYLDIVAGEVVGLVGESGCGKSTLGRIAAGLIPLSAGKRYWKGAELRFPRTSKDHLAQIPIQMIFQDSTASLNPRMRALDIVGEAPVVHGMVKKANQQAFVQNLMEKVGLDAAMFQRFPHQFSGGQRARLGIARALAVNPQLLICDEAVAALDVSVQAQVLNLFMQLRNDLALTYLFISHDLGVVKHVADRVVIMYLGRVVESAAVDELFCHANHPYSQGLLASAPKLIAQKIEFVPVKGEIPSPLYPPSGCHFHPRCPYRMERCVTEIPILKKVAALHFSACHLND